MSNPTTKIETKYAIARNGEIIGDTPLIDDLDVAKRQLEHIEGSMRSASLEPDVELVTIDVKTTYAKPKAYVTTTTSDLDGDDDEPAPGVGAN